MRQFDLEKYLSGGVDKIVKGVVKASLSNPKQSLFLASYAIASKKAKVKRHQFKEQGTHIPPFLIASITNKCNLHCAGCYARANHSHSDNMLNKQLTDTEWGNIFLEASNLGIGFILLAGGEPLMRKEVILEAAKYQEIIFPIFTNGTLLHTYYNEFDSYRNLIPILSIEGNSVFTDSRRGKGIYDILHKNMTRLKEQGILFGTSITVTSENMHNVMSDEFLDELHELGCKVVIYVEYVPIDRTTTHLAVNDDLRDDMNKRLELIRDKQNDIVFISFPGDEKTSGGCLAAGRGFFHINATGGAEPCPFSPYSDTSLRESSLLEALSSPLFKKLASEEILGKQHIGGCVLFEQEEEVKSLLKSQ